MVIFCSERGTDTLGAGELQMRIRLGPTAFEERNEIQPTMNALLENIAFPQAAVGRLSVDMLDSRVERNTTNESEILHWAKYLTGNSAVTKEPSLQEGPGTENVRIDT